MTPPSAPRALGTATRFLVAALLLGALALVVRARQGRPEGMAELAGASEAAGRCAPVSACGPQILQDLPDRPTVDYDAACRDGAYLCAGLEVGRSPLRALRWRDVPSIRIVVAWPSSGYDGNPRRQQQAAVRGLRAWDGHPLKLVVEAQPEPRTDGVPQTTNRRVAPSRPAPSRTAAARSSGLLPYEIAEPDIELTWNVEPATEEWGEAYASWGTDRRYPGYGMKVQSMAVPTLTEWPGGRMLTEREVAAAAAHAMGHALGLPHSTAPADVMYPLNSAQTPSPDDLRAVAALYALPNGAEIRRPEGSR